MNREVLEKFISATYHADAEFPWVKYPNYIVFRHRNNQKWFALVLEVPKEKLGLWKAIKSSSKTGNEKIEETCTIHKKPEEKPQNTVTNTNTTNTTTGNTTNTTGGKNTTGNTTGTTNTATNTTNTNTTDANKKK